MDLQEFKTKVLPAKQKIYRLALFLLRDKQEAEDVLQDVFLKLWTQKEKLSAYNSIEALAMSIARNQCLDKLKSRKRKMMVDVTGIDMRSDDATPYQHSEMADSMHNMRRLVDGLPEQQRLVLHLRDVEGYSFEEIEQITSLTVNNLRVILSRARKSVRDGFLKLEKYEVG